MQEEVAVVLRRVEIPKLCLKLFAAEERWQLHAEEVALLQYQSHLPDVLPRCYGRFLIPVMANASRIVRVDVLVLEWVGRTLFDVLQEMCAETRSELLRAGVVEIFVRVLWSCEQLSRCGVRIAGPDCHRMCVEESTGSFKFVAPQCVQVVWGVVDFSTWLRPVLKGQACSVFKSEPGRVYASLWREQVQHGYLGRTMMLCAQLGCVASRIIATQERILDTGLTPRLALIRIFH